MTNELNRWSQHTPEPWDIDGDTGLIYGIAPQDNGQVPVCRIETLGDDQEEFANARLIVTAPELLKALEAVIDRGDAESLFQKDILAQARTAIAKARGQT